MKYTTGKINYSETLILRSTKGLAKCFCYKGGSLYRGFPISGVRYMGILFLVFSYYLAGEHRSLYRGLRSLRTGSRLRGAQQIYRSARSTSLPALRVDRIICCAPLSREPVRRLGSSLHWGSLYRVVINSVYRGKIQLLYFKIGR